MSSAKEPEQKQSNKFSLFNRFSYAEWLSVIAVIITIISAILANFLSDRIASKQPALVDLRVEERIEKLNAQIE